MEDESKFSLVDIAGTLEALLYTYPGEPFADLVVKAGDHLHCGHPGWLTVSHFLSVNCHVLLCENGALLDDEEYFGGEATEYVYRVWRACPEVPGHRAESRVNGARATSMIVNGVQYRPERDVRPAHVCRLPLGDLDQTPGLSWN